MYICIHVCIDTNIYELTDKHMNQRIHVYIHTYMRVCVCMYISMCVLYTVGSLQVIFVLVVSLDVVGSPLLFVSSLAAAAADDDDDEEEEEERTNDEVLAN